MEDNLLEAVESCVRSVLKVSMQFSIIAFNGNLGLQKGN